MKFLGIEFAPLVVPMHRRYETLAVGACFFIILFSTLISFLVCLYLPFTRLWWLVPLYAFWIYLDRHVAESGGRRSNWVQNWRWLYHLKNYFPVETVYSEGFTLDPDRNYFFCCFPHGILAMGPYAAIVCAWSNFRKSYPKFTVKYAIVSTFTFQPIIRELGLAIEMISCSAKSINYELSRPEGGHIVILMPGGAMEAYNSQPGKYKFVLKNRKGFVKVALRNGSSLVPVISFGETEVFDQIDNPALRKVQEFLRKYILFGLPPMVFNGRGFFQYSFGIIPRRRPVTTVLGTPVEVTKLENPTNEQVEELHSKFVQSLIALFEKYKYNYLENPEDKYLELL